MESSDNSDGLLFVSGDIWNAIFGLYVNIEHFAHYIYNNDTSTIK